MRLVTASMDATLHRPGRSWWWRAGRSRWFAWVLSAGLHGAVFTTLYLAVFREDGPPQRVIIPEANLVGQNAPPSPSWSQVSLELARQPLPSLPEESTVALDEQPITSGAPDTPMLTSAGIAALMDNAGAIPSGAVPLPTTPAGPISSFFGQAGNAYRVVYVVDVSASLWIYVEEIIREMRASIAGLVPTQRFHVVLARPGRVEELAPRRLVPATGQYKQQAGQFLDTVSGRPGPGPAQPIEAMERAFAVKPELIYFLSDGDYTRIQDELERRLEQLNADRAVKITVIGFGPSPSARTLLERIARTHGGNFRAVEPQS